MFQQNVQYSIQNSEVYQERKPTNPKENTYSIVRNLQIIKLLKLLNMDFKISMLTML